MKETANNLKKRIEIRYVLDFGYRNREYLKKPWNIWFRVFDGKCYVPDDGSRHYLVFQTIFDRFTTTASGEKSLSIEIIKTPAPSDNMSTSFSKTDLYSLYKNNL